MSKRKKHKRNISIARKMLQFLLFLVLAQSALFIAVLSFNGGINDLQEKSCSDFNNVVQERSSSMENLMVNSWSNLDLYTEYINESIRQQLDDAECTVADIAVNKSLNNEILVETASVLIGMLRNNSVNEVYMVLNGYGAEDQSVNRCGVLIRDLDLTVNAGYEDLLLEVGPNKLSRDLGIAMDRYWTSTFDLTADSAEASYYWEPYQAAVENPDLSIQDLGYWSGLFQWTGSDMEVLSYSLPLIMDGETYGVLGVTVSKDQLQSLMNYNELADGRGSYVLATADRDGAVYTPVLTSGILNLVDLKEDEPIVTEKNAYVEDVYKMENTDDYVSVHVLSLYNQASVHNREKWVLLGIEAEDELFSMFRRLYEAIFLSLVLSVLIGFFLAGWGTIQVTKPITDLNRILRDNKDKKKLSFPHTNIREVDELQKAIIVMDENVRENASKLSGIVELVGMPLGAMEYSSDAPDVFCTSQVVELLEMDPEEYHNQNIPRGYFEDYMEKHGLSEILLFDSEKRYLLNGEKRDIWLLFRSKVESDKVLIVVTDVTEETLEKQRIEYERDYDTLTHLLNRRAFRRKITSALQDKDSGELGLCAMVMWDLDNLKYINDSYGHDYGDQYIQKAADVFYNEAGENAYVGRLSGDEFLMFFMKRESKQSFIDTINEIRDKLNATKVIMSDGEAIAIRASGGVAWYPDDGDNYDELKRYADYAMYDTKSSYKGTVKEFNRQAYEHDYLLLTGKEQLNKLIDQNAVNYVFQPIVNAHDGSVLGYEALMRPYIEGLKTPGDVMRLARNQARLTDIEWMTFHTVSQCYREQRKAFADKKIFINSIPDQRIDRERIQKLIWSEEYLWGNVVVEILESEQADLQTVLEKKTHIQQLGAEIALDDFGVGYSSEASLLYLKPHYAKIDIAFCRGIAADKNRQTLVRNLIRYARPRGVCTIAEGIENREDMETLIKLGVDMLQGFYIGRPDEVVKDISDEIRQEILRVRLTNK